MSTQLLHQVPNKHDALLINVPDVLVCHSTWHCTLPARWLPPALAEEAEHDERQRFSSVVAAVVAGVAASRQDIQGSPLSSTILPFLQSLNRCGLSPVLAASTVPACWRQNRPRHDMRVCLPSSLLA